MTVAAVTRRARAWAGSGEGRAALLAMAAIFPLLVWWLGWFPGFLSSDSVDQLGQARRFEVSNSHPAAHTLAMWLVLAVWDNPGAVSLAQVVLMTGMLALVSARLARLGVPWWLAGGSAALVAALPAVSTTTLALWKDVPYTLALMWAFAETLALAADPERFLHGRWGAIRMGAALALAWLFRHNGFLTVIPFLAVVLWWGRARWRRLWPAVATLAVSVVAVQYLLYPALGVDRAAIEPGAVFISDVAASLRHEPGNFTPEELAYLETIAPLEVWRHRYDCHDSTALVFGEAFNSALITADPGRFRQLVVDTYLRDPDTVLGHRWCAASYLVWPPQPGNAYFQRPPFEIATNDQGIARNPISERAFDLTLAIFEWADPPGRLWLTWRPALAVWLGIVTYAALAWRRRRLLLAGALIAAQIVNVAATTPAQEFRFAFPVYVLCLLSVPLLWIARTAGVASGNGAPAQAQATSR